MVKRRRLTKAQRLQVYEKYGGKCAYCGNHITLDEMQVDHVKPLALGGADDISNFASACRMCNKPVGFFFERRRDEEAELAERTLRLKIENG